jgi:hypothetical protein
MVVVRVGVVEGDVLDVAHASGVQRPTRSRIRGPVACMVNGRAPQPAPPAAWPGHAGDQPDRPAQPDRDGAVEAAAGRRLGRDAGPQPGPGLAIAQLDRGHTQGWSEAEQAAERP